MSISHKFKRIDFNNEFKTNNTILDIVPYRPEVMIIGTFNPNTLNANFADFFYGRNFFWPAFKNLFVHNNIIIQNRRMPTRGTPPLILNPSLEEIFILCKRIKITFADLIIDTFHINNPQFQILNNDNIIFDGEEYNLIQDNRQNGVNGLEELDLINQINWNTDNIIDFLCENPQIKSIYLTRKPTGIWGREWTKLVNHKCMKGRYIANIFTPSGAGKPVNRTMRNLLNHWVHNNNQNFGKFDNTWLKSLNVNCNNF